jgi:hypothetical protein
MGNLCKAKIRRSMVLEGLNSCGTFQSSDKLLGAVVLSRSEPNLESGGDSVIQIPQSVAALGNQLDLLHTATRKPSGLDIHLVGYGRWAF